MKYAVPPPTGGDPPGNAEAEPISGPRSTKISHRQATASLPILSAATPPVPAHGGYSIKPRKDNLLVAPAARYEPSGRRTTWALVYHCPVCFEVHFGRSATADADGERRSGCGKQIWLSVCEAAQ